jgi:DNA-binding transcriptional LysR family regulator
MWTLTQLRYFNILTQTLNYREAAERLDISEPALSMQIRKLESVLGTKLFHRQGRAIALTTAGRQFTFHAIQILQAVDDANRSVTARTPQDAASWGLRQSPFLAHHRPNRRCLSPTHHSNERVDHHGYH